MYIGIDEERDIRAIVGGLFSTLNLTLESGCGCGCGWEVPVTVAAVLLVDKILKIHGRNATADNPGVVWWAIFPTDTLNSDMHITKGVRGDDVLLLM